MNRRGFISLLAGAAGAPLVPWRGLTEPLIFLPPRELVMHVTIGAGTWLAHGPRGTRVSLEPLRAGARVFIGNAGLGTIEVWGAAGGGAHKLPPAGFLEARSLGAGEWAIRQRPD